jgi:hypothetical protein
VKDDVFVDNDVFLVTDFINFKTKVAQFFKDVYKDRVYIHIFIKVSTHRYLHLYRAFKQ